MKMIELAPQHYLNSSACKRWKSYVIITLNYKVCMHGTAKLDLLKMLKPKVDLLKMLKPNS